MLRIFLLATLVVCLSALKISPKDCGQRPLAPDSKIVNGTIGVAGDFGWTVSLRRPSSHFCGGTLIRKQWVISAAHCFASSTAETTVVAVHDAKNPEEWSRSVKTEKIFVHENYNSLTISNDIALLRLKEPLEYSDHIVPACIAESPSDYKKGANSFHDLFLDEEAYLSGWGYLESGGVVQSQKNHVRLDAKSDVFCKSFYSQYGYDINVMTCAGDLQSLAGACQGDSGGPWVTFSPDEEKWFNWGITSWGVGCGKGTVFGRVTAFIDWIKDKMDRYPDEDAPVVTP